MKKQENKNTRSPPDTQNFKELFEFFWVHGLGNKFAEHEIPIPWTAETLESVFTDIGVEIDKRSIQNWKSGKHKPDRTKIHALARIISGNDNELQTRWADALIAAARAKPKAPEPAVPTKSPVPQPAKESKIVFPFIIGAGVLSTLVFGVFLGMFFSQTKLPKVNVTHIRFCDEARFSKKQKTCVGTVHHFPLGTKMIYVSFQMHDMPRDYPFKRQWLRNGQLFTEKESFYDSAWEDFTWILNKDGHVEGKYDMRVIVDNKTTTSTFTVGAENIGTFTGPQ
ncbi:MAG: hypothetical protein COA91_02200 [Robiginitomaculum sp.]|nr:MAG: hypothetical protein COA91_02200 [Robiginitomaculum sp.]